MRARGAGGKWTGEKRFETIETSAGVLIERLRPEHARIASEVGGDDEVDLFLDVVEGEDLVEEHEAGVGDVELVGCRERGQTLDLADDVVGEEADGTGGEGRQTGEAGGNVCGEGSRLSSAKMSPSKVRVWCRRLRV